MRFLIDRHFVVFSFISCVLGRLIVFRVLKVSISLTHTHTHTQAISKFLYKYSNTMTFSSLFEVSGTFLYVYFWNIFFICKFVCSICTSIHQAHHFKEPLGHIYWVDTFPSYSVLAEEIPLSLFVRTVA